MKLQDNRHYPDVILSDPFDGPKVNSGSEEARLLAEFLHKNLRLPSARLRAGFAATRLRMTGRKELF